MASCDLSIELDRTRDDHTYDVSETIRGVVRVRVDKDVNCSGLEVRTLWATHGRGNVDSKVVDSKIVDAGQWSTGQTKEYPFELTVGGWPPTYHGHYLNVDHYVEARAKIPWGFDPKASLPFQMKPSRYPDDAASTPGVMHVSPNVSAHHRHPGHDDVHGRWFRNRCCWRMDHDGDLFLPCRCRRRLCAAAFCAARFHAGRSDVPPRA